jgi:hypothetical protein
MDRNQGRLGSFQKGHKLRQMEMGCLLISTW